MSYPKTYLLKDFKNREILGSFYPEELSISKQKIYWYKIEKERLNKDGTKDLFVKWEDWGKEYSSWIKDSNENTE